MKTISVEVKKDHIERLANVKKPIIAIAELIWNSFDADAENVTVSFEDSGLGRIDKITVADDGHGIEYDQAEDSFKNLGGSWKRENRATKLKQRLLHGRLGKGRFRAFSLGKNVEWNTTYKSNGQVYNYSILGNAATLGTFTINDKMEGASKTGTKVEITNISKAFRSIVGKTAIQEITELFALYLTLYPNLKLKYDGVPISPSECIKNQVIYQLNSLEVEKGITIDADLVIVEWNNQTDRKLFLCDSAGFTYDEVVPGIQAPGFIFTAYLKSDYIRNCDERALLLEGNPGVSKLMEVAKIKLKEYFRKRKAELGRVIVEKWKEEDIYPYKGEPRSIIERTERQVFDICALNLNEYLTDFNNLPVKNKRLSLRLLKHALETSPTKVREIFEEVLDLSAEKQEEFASLIKKASLDSIIAASKDITDRLDFLKGLEALVFDKELKENLLERKQLHRIVANHTWIFGEKYNLSVDDESLTMVLRQHMSFRGEHIIIDEPVLRRDGRKGVVDLMLSRNIPQADADLREHLIVELKRPMVKVDLKAFGQISSYAEAISNDERFKDTKTTWTFWVVSNEIDPSVRNLADQRYRPFGLIVEKESYCIWVVNWAQIFQKCRARLQIYQDRLNYNATRDSGLEYLKRTHEKYLPSCLTNQAI